MAGTTSCNVGKLNGHCEEGRDGEGQFAELGCVTESAGAEEQRLHQRQVIFCCVASVSVTTLSLCCTQEVWQMKKKNLPVYLSLKIFSFL